MSFHLKKNDKSILGLLVICSSNSYELYSGIWTFICGKIPNIKNCLKTIFCDYDNDLVRATRDIFPSLEIRGSWFHFIRLWTRKWKSLDLPFDSIHPILKLCWVLPLLPVDKFKSAFDIMLSLAGTDETNSFNLTMFVTNLKVWCEPLAHMLSFTNDADENDINISEDFIRKIENHLGYKPKLHRYFDNIAKVIETSTEQWKIKDTKKIPRKAFQIRIDKTIRSFQNLLVKDKITINEFVINIFKDKAFVREIKHQLSHAQYKLDNGVLENIPNYRLFMSNPSLNINEDENASSISEESSNDNSSNDNSSNDNSSNDENSDSENSEEQNSGSSSED